MKKRFLLILPVPILIICLIIGIIINKPRMAEMDYKPLTLPPWCTFLNPTFGDLIMQSDIIIEGKVLKTIENVKVEYINEKGSVEDKIEKKAKKLSNDEITKSTAYIMETSIEVENCIQGKVDSKVITLVQPQDFKGYVPELKEGERMVFFLSKQKNTDNRYITVHPHASFFYKNESGLVYPVYQEGEFAQFKNVNISELKNKVKNFDRSLYKPSIIYKK